MNKQQAGQRDQIMSQLWAVEDAHGSDAAVTREVAVQSATRLRQLLAVIDRYPGGLEQARAWRYLGDCHYTAAGKADQQKLRLARDAWLRAEETPGGGDDPVEQAKLNFNLANGARLIDAGRNRALMEEAKLRYERALDLFEKHLPEAVARVDASLRSLRTALQALQVIEFGERSARREQQLRCELDAQEAAPDAEVLVDTSRRIRGLQGEADQQLFNIAFSKITQAASGDEISPQREAALRSMLSRFQSIMQEPVHSDEQARRRSARARHLIQSGKAMTDQRDKRG